MEIGWERDENERQKKKRKKKKMMMRDGKNKKNLPSLFPDMLRKKATPVLRKRLEQECRRRS